MGAFFEFDSAELEHARTGPLRMSIPNRLFCLNLAGSVFSGIPLLWVLSIIDMSNPIPCTIANVMCRSGSAMNS